MLRAMERPLRLISIIALFAVSLGLSACASMDAAGKRQAVLVRSEPPGAEVIVKGRSVARTPAYVMIKRERSPEITLRNENGSTDVELNTTYRWRDSFLPNLVFVTYAWAGWIVDFATGAAWDAQNPRVVRIPGPRPQTYNRLRDRRQYRAAIAPPLADNIALSDEAGQELERVLRSSQDGVLSYDSTLNTFVSNGYDFDSRRTRTKRDLYFDLGVDAIYEAEVIDEDSHLTVRTKRTDVYTGESERVADVTLSRDSDLLPKGAWNLPWLRSIVPNSVGIDWVADNLRITNNSTGANGKMYELTDVHEGGFAKGLSYLSALSITSLPELRSGRASRGTFAFVPSFRVSRKDARLSGSDLPGETDFLRWWVSAGIGPEIGFQVSSHYLYLNVIPSLYWNELSWSRNGLNRERTGTGSTFQIEFGYLFYATSNWTFRLFSRTQNEDNAAWEEATQEIIPNTSTGALSVSRFTAGLSIAYRFQAERYRRR